MSNFTIRLANNEDLVHIAQLELESNAGMWTKAGFLSAFNEQSQQLYIIESDSAVVACLVGMLAADELTLMHIVVAEPFRQQGLASKLYQYWLDQIHKDHDFQTVWLEVRESNTSAQNAYLNWGFEQVGLRKQYYKKPKENAVVMRLTI